MPLVTSSYEDNWGSDADNENGQLTHSKSRPSSALHPTHASLSATPVGSEANDIDSDSVNPQDSNRFAQESTLLEKTGWLVLRSTAKSLNNVLRNLGVTGLRVHQIYNSEVHPEWRVKCFILLYKWAPERGDLLRWNPEALSRPCVNNQRRTLEDDSGIVQDNDQVLFSCQSMDNASATQALVMAVLNITDDQFENDNDTIRFSLGDDLSRLKAYVQPMDPIVRSAAISSSLAVRNAHNKAAREQPGGHPDLLDEDGKLQSIALADEFWMYTVYIPGFRGACLHQLHGIADEPETLFLDDKESWASAALHAIQKKVVTLQDHNTPFFAFAVTSDSKRQNLTRPPRKMKMAGSDGDETESSSDRDSSQRDGSSAENRNSSQDVDSDRQDTMDEPDQEAVKDEVERIRATHNYDTFIIEMMKLMASRGDLNGLIRDYPEFGDGQSTEDEEGE